MHLMEGITPEKVSFSLRSAAEHVHLPMLDRAKVDSKLQVKLIADGDVLSDG